MKLKSILLFIGGMLTTALILVIISMFEKSNNGITWFPEKGECITNNKLKVFQVLEPGMALAMKKDSYDSPVIAVINNEGKHYYDDEVINIPQKKCARQVGTYGYQTKDQRWKTVPVVIID